jgi:lipopolysaccharide export system protein LptA
MWKKGSVVFAMLVAASWLYAAQDNTVGKRAMPGAGHAEPIRITADRLDAYNERHMVVFSGNATAIQGAQVIKADRIWLYYKKDPGEGTKGDLAGGNLEKIEAKGGVTITDGQRTVTGGEAVFYRDYQKIIVTGNPVMREGENVVRGERIIVLLQENRGVIEGAKGNRVTATIYPKEFKEKNK